MQAEAKTYKTTDLLYLFACAFHKAPAKHGRHDITPTAQHQLVGRHPPPLSAENHVREQSLVQKELLGHGAVSVVQPSPDAGVEKLVTFLGILADELELREVEKTGYVHCLIQQLAVLGQLHYASVEKL